MERKLVETWAEAAAEHASLREIDDSDGVVATIAGLDGVWAQGADARAAKAELLEVLIDWAALKIERGDDDIPSALGSREYPAERRLIARVPATRREESAG